MDREWYDPDPDPIFLVIPDPAGHQNKTKEKSDEFYVLIKVLQQDSLYVASLKYSRESYIESTTEYHLENNHKLTLYGFVCQKGQIGSRIRIFPYPEKYSGLNIQKCDLWNMHG